MVNKIILLLLLAGLMVVQCQFPDQDDTTPPTVEVNFPYTGAVVSSNSQVLVDIDDNEKVKNVKFYLDDMLGGETTERPYTMPLIVDGLKDGLEHRLKVIATDKENNIGSSEDILFIIAENEDIIDPTVRIINPQEGQTVEGSVRIVAVAEDERSIQKVAFFIDGDSVGIAASYPYNFDWNTTPFADSTNHTIYAKAFDGGNNTTTSDAVTVTVYPRTTPTDDTPPNVLILYPVSGSSVSGTIEVVADVSDENSVTQVEFYIDGQLVSTDTNGTDNWSYSWNTAPYSDGQNHSIYVKAYDSSNNVGTSALISVLVP